MLVSVSRPLMGDEKGQVDASASSCCKRFWYLLSTIGRADGACELGAFDWNDGCWHRAQQGRTITVTHGVD